MAEEDKSENHRVSKLQGLGTINVFIKYHGNPFGIVIFQSSPKWWTNQPTDRLTLPAIELGH